MLNKVTRDYDDVPTGAATQDRYWQADFDVVNISQMTLRREPWDVLFFYLDVAFWSIFIEAERMDRMERNPKIFQFVILLWQQLDQLSDVDHRQVHIV